MKLESAVDTDTTGSGVGSSQGKSWVRSAIKWTGALLTVGSLVWYFNTLTTHLDVFHNVRLNFQTAAAIILGIALYPLIYTVGATVWVCGLRVLDTSLSLRPAIAIFFVAQFGKYFPGNVAHHVARVVLAKKCGVSAKRVMLSMIIETINLIFCGVLIASIALFLNPKLRARVQEYLPAEVPWVAGLGIPVGLIVLIIAVRIVQRWGSSDLNLKWLIPCVAIQSLVFLLHGIIAQIILKGVFGVEGISLATITGLFAIAWVAGFVTPGAPAGIGVREAVLTLGMESVCGPGVAVGLAAILRVVSALGDGITFGIGLLLQTRHKDDPCENKPINRQSERSPKKVF